MNYCVRPLLFVGAIAATLLAYKSTTGADPEPSAEPQTALEKAAEQAYFAHVIAFENDYANIDDVYRWSRRWTEAELRANRDRQKSAFDHLQRMQRFYLRAVALRKAGAKGGSTETVNATTYYVEEAKLDVLQTQLKK